MKRNKFSLSNYKLLTADMGQLIPINLTEVLPGDTIQQATSMLIRLSPLLAPVMHPIQVRVHHWYVPFRLIWDDFEKFITGGPDGNDASVPPYKTGYHEAGTLYDYLGVPINTGNFDFSALPARAYHLIWNEFYRDQDLQSEATISKASGVDETDYNIIRSVCWEKDYFTSCRPWTQKGDDISISLGSNADVESAGDGIPLFDADGNPTGLSDASMQVSDSSANIHASETPNTTGAINLKWADPKLSVDLSTATAVTINELREAFALQRYAEARAKYGSRYTEYLRYLGVNSADARLNRPEYLGGGKQTMQISEVIQTGGTSAGAPDGVGNLAGHGISALRSNRYRRFFEEHGYIISLMSVRPKTIYADGLHKMFSRQTKEDFFQRELQGIGQAEVLKQEVNIKDSNKEQIFGYQDRYDEYRRAESMIHGEFRDDLDHWHMARIFAGDVELNSDFVTCAPTKRIHAVQNKNTLWVMVNNSIQARRMVGR